LKNRKKDIFTVRNGKYYFKNEIVPESIAKMINDFYVQDIPFDAILNFWKRLKKNPLESARSELLLFMNHNGIPLREDGMFVCYKKIREDWKDVHSGKFDNSVGKLVQMKRDQVNTNREETCSSGLHVAAWSYMNEYNGERIVEVLVDPVDVVSIPNDHNNAKMRVCKYKVLREVKTENQQLHYDTTSLKKASKGRVLVPASFVQKVMKGSKGKYLYLHLTSGKIVLSREKSENYYKIDEHFNIRLSQTMLAKAGLDGYEEFQLSYDDANKQILLEA
jgi:hypothetical protein